jgi:hypothetical protein
MPLNLVKLCVGVDTLEDLKSHVEARLAAARARGEPAEQGHVTRVRPVRADEILSGGSLYWVIRGNVQVRQRILRLDEALGADGITRCRIVLEPLFVSTHWQPRRPFQGWRYLKPEDAPQDLGEGGEDLEALPPDLRRELAMLGLM